MFSYEESLELLNKDPELFKENIDRIVFSYEESLELLNKDPELFKEKVQETLRRHVTAVNKETI